MRRKEMTFKEVKELALRKGFSWRAPSMREIADGKALWLSDEKTYVVLTNSKNVAT